MACAVSKPTIAVIYIARGADKDALAKFSAFRASYDAHAAGVAHRLFVVFKGFADAKGLRAAQIIFETLPHAALFLDDAGFDLGAYYSAAAVADEQLICCLNTASIILGEQWLRKLLVNYCRPGVNMVGCTASLEAPRHAGATCATFPNPHLRSNAFLIDRCTFIALRRGMPFGTKLEAHLFEHGPEGLTRQLESTGGKVLLVSRDGRGHEPGWWVRSGVFRQGDQENLLVGDNQTAGYLAAPIGEKRALFQLAWGDGSLGQVAL